VSERLVHTTNRITKLLREFHFGRLWKLPDGNSGARPSSSLTNNPAVDTMQFLKEHRKVQEREANAVRQQKQIEALSAGLQKVSVQLELSKSAPQTVLNNH